MPNTAKMPPLQDENPTRLSLTPQVHLSTEPSAPITDAQSSCPFPQTLPNNNTVPHLPLPLPLPLTTHPFHNFPVFRLQLTLCYTSAAHSLVRANTTLIKQHYLSAQLANAGALDLARCCCSEGEVVMLMHQTRVPNTGAAAGRVTDWLLNDYWVGVWEEDEAIIRDSVFLRTEVQGFMVKRVRGRVSGQVKVLYEEGGGGEVLSRLSGVV